MWLSAQLNKTEGDMEAWYSVTYDDFLANHGKALLNKFDYSPYQILKHVFPQFEFLPWKFSRAPRGFWEKKENQLAYMKWLAKELKREEGIPEQWYTVSRSDFVANFGTGLLNKFNGSHTEALMTLYPDASWAPWRFNSTPQTYFDRVENQRIYLDWLGKRLNFTKQEDWYKIRWEHFLENDGSTLLDKYYEGSPSKMIAAVFSDYPYLPWMFENRRLGLGKDEDTMKEMLKYVEQKLEMKSLDDWYRVSGKALNEMGIGFAIQREGGLAKVLPKLYPQHKWDLSSLRSVSKKEAS